MKKIIVILFASLIGMSCSMDDNSTDYFYDILPIESHELPSSFELGKTYTLKLFYKLPSDCHTNPSLYFEKNAQIRTLAIQSLVANRADCNFIANEDLHELTFQFEVLTSLTYVFKIYKGDDENGDPIFENTSIPVTN